MKGLLLDTEENQIRKVEVNELHDYYKAMHCDCITVVYTELEGQQLVIICDDEALCKSGCLIPTVKLSSGDTIFNSVIFLLLLSLDLMISVTFLKHWRILFCRK